MDFNAVDDIWHSYEGPCARTKLTHSFCSLVEVFGVLLSSVSTIVLKLFTFSSPLLYAVDHIKQDAQLVRVRDVRQATHPELLSAVDGARELANPCGKVREQAACHPAPARGTRMWLTSRNKPTNPTTLRSNGHMESGCESLVHADGRGHGALAALVGVERDFPRYAGLRCPVFYEAMLATIARYAVVARKFNRCPVCLFGGRQEPQKARARASSCLASSRRCSPETTSRIVFAGRSHLKS